MLCHPSSSTLGLTLCGAPIGLDWFDVALTPDYRRITCRNCRSWWNHHHPDSRIPSRERPYVQRYSVTSTTEKVIGLSWEDALSQFRDTYAYASDPEVIERNDFTSAYLMTGDRVISAFLSIEGETVIDTRNGVGIHQLSRGDD